MRALTVRQPWSWAIIHGGKDVENRSRNIAGSYRGPIAITAALTLDRDYDRRLIAQSVGRLARSGERVGRHDVAQRAGHPLTRFNAITERFGNLGAILGVVDITGVHAGIDDVDDELGWWPCSEWAQQVGYHLVLANPRPLPTPIPVRGRLGLWTLPDDVAAQVEEALR
jgi:hypothetical protein